MRVYESDFSTTFTRCKNLIGDINGLNVSDLGRTFISFVSLAIIVSCSALDGVEVEPVEDVKVRNIDGSLRLPGQKSGFSIFGDDKNIATSQSFPFNLYLWQSSIKAFGEIGIAQISPESGTIISEWFKSDDGTETQITAIIGGMDLISQNLVVRSARRYQADKKSSNLGSEIFNARMKDLILANARDLRMNKIGPAIN